MDDGALIRLLGRAGEPNANVRMRPAGAVSRPAISGLEPSAGKTHYLMGSNPAGWTTDVATYSRVRYAGIYPGIDLTYYGNQRQLEYDFLIQPGSRPETVEMQFDGVRGIGIDDEGGLVLRTAAGDIRQPRPVVYQEDGGRRIPVKGEYELRGGHRAGFRIGVYDRTKPLTIDPVIVYSTYFGGTKTGALVGDQAKAIAVDSAGSVYVTGVTFSTDLLNVNAAQTTQHGGTDAFVFKLDPTGTVLLYATYFGGLGNDEGHGIAIDGAGNAYITGYTSSDNLPTTPNAAQRSRAGNEDAYLLKLNPAGNTMLYSTFLGGSGDDRGYGVALDTKGGIYIAGSTGSGNFTVASPFQASNAGGLGDVFITKFGPTGTIQYSTYAGGRGNDQPYGIAVDVAGAAYVVGLTTSGCPPVDPAAKNTIPCDANAGPFPHVRAFQADFGGGSDDAFLLKLSPAGNSLEYSTFLGGLGSENATRVAVNADGMACVTGYTSTDVTAPVAFPLVNQLQPALGGGFDAFITCFAPDGQSLVLSTYYGGESNDSGAGIAFDAAGNLYVAGYTESFLLPAVNSVQASYGGSRDGFLLRLNPGVPNVLFASYFGGAGIDAITGLAVDSSSNVYVTGLTASTNFPLKNALQPQNNGGFDSFVAKVATADVVSDSNFSVTDRGGVAFKTTGARSDAVFGYAAADAARTPLNGLAILEDKASRGLTTTQVGITAEEMSPTGRVFVEVTSKARSVLSIANPSDSNASVDFFYTDAAGTPDHFATVTIPAHTHFSRFVTDDPFGLPLDSIGTINFTASIPVAATAFRTLNNERSDFLISNTPIANLARPLSGRPSTIPEFADGANWTSQIILVNPSEERMNGEARFYNQGSVSAAGMPVVVAIDSSGNSASVLEYDIAPRSVQRIQTTGAPARSAFPFTTNGGFAFRTTGSATDQANGFAVETPAAGSAWNGLAITELQQNGATVSQTGLPAPPLRQNGRFFAESAAQVQTTMTIVNPADGDVGVDLYFTDQSGVSASPVKVTIGGRAQFIQSVAADPLNIAIDSAGTVTFSASAPVAVSVMRTFTNEKGEFVTSAIPVADLSRVSAQTSVAPILADGDGWTSSVVLINPTDRQMSGDVRLRTQGSAAAASAPLTVGIGDGSSAASAVAYDIPPRSTRRIETSGTGIRSVFPFSRPVGFALNTTPAAAAQTTGYASAVSATSNTSLNGLQLLDHLESGAITGRAVTISNPLFRSGRFFIEGTAAVKSLVAIANPSDTEASVNLFFTDSAGAPNYFSSVTVAPRAQFSGFVSDAPLSIPAGSAGTVSFTSSVRVAVSAFRYYTNDSGRLTVSSTPIADSTQTTAQPSVIPYFADGANWYTQIVLVNSGETRMNGELRFFSPGSGAAPGAPVLVAIGSGDTSASVLEYDVPPRSFRTFRTAGIAANFTAGSIQVAPFAGTDTPHAHAILSMLISGTTLFQTAVEAQTPATSARIYAEAAGDFAGAARGSTQTLIAMTNPSSSVSTVRLSLTSLDGTAIGTSGPISIPPNGQVSLLMNQLPGFQNLPSSFAGVVQLTTVSGPPVTAVGFLETVNYFQQLIVATTGPLKEDASAAQLVVPYVVSGNAFKSQLIVVNGAAAQSASGVLSFFAQDSSPLNIDEFKIGSVYVVPSAGSNAPATHVVLRRQFGGTTLLETSVDTRPAGSSFKLYAEASGDFLSRTPGSTQTAIAIANPSASPASVQIELANLEGTALAGPAAVTVPANGETLMYLNEIPGFQSLPSFDAGFVRLTTVSPASVGVAGFRALYNSRGDLLITTTGPLFEDTAAPAALVLPYMTDGGGYSTRVILSSGAPRPQAASGVLQFFGTNGASLNMDELRTGSVQIVPFGGTTTPHAHSVVSYAPKGVTLFQTSIEAQCPASSLRLYAESAGDFGAGEALSRRTTIAIANPSSSPATVRLELRSLTGAALASSTALTIPANGQIANYLNEIPGLQSIPRSFQGILTVTDTSGSGTTAASFRSMFNEGGEAIVTTTGPLNEAASATRLVFPHIAEGGGFTSTFIIVNGAGQGTSGVLRFVTEKGTPLGLTLSNP